MAGNGEEGEAEAAGSQSPGVEGAARCRPDTVDELVDEVKFHAQFEESRLNATNQRAAWLLALNGVILGLVASQALEMLSQARLLGPGGRSFAAISLMAAVLLVVVSAGCALKVVFKAKSWEWDLKEIEEMPGDDFAKMKRVTAQRAFIRGLAKRIRRERTSYNSLRRWLDAAFITLGVALVAVALHIGAYSVHTIQTSCPATGKPNSTSVRQVTAGKFDGSWSVVALPIADTTPTTPSEQPEEDRPRGKDCSR